ncbi:MAG: osmotically inducible protein OsmC [Chitinophagaceae bacterium]|nr:osmotically inducible protein OsmC [Chitinophagaceae bacterium]
MLANRKEYFYEVDLVWNSERTGTLSSLGLPEIEVVTPPEFVKGQKNKWTPEHLLAGAVASCLMTNFLAIAEGFQLDIIAYKSHCFVKLERKEGKLEATEILIRPTVTLISDKELAKAIQLIEKAERSCPIKNALQLNINVHPQFEFLNSEEKIKK